VQPISHAAAVAAAAAPRNKVLASGATCGATQASVPLHSLLRRGSGCG